MYLLGDFEPLIFVYGTVELIAHLVRIVHRAPAYVVDYLCHERIRPFGVGPRELLPEHFDLIENGQRVDSRRTVFDRRVHLDELVQVDRSFDALHRFVRGDIQPPGDALLEPQVILGQMARLQIYLAFDFADSETLKSTTSFSYSKHRRIRLRFFALAECIRTECKCKLLCVNYHITRQIFEWPYKARTVTFPSRADRYRLRTVRYLRN